jgi:hypothetical protein
MIAEALLSRLDGVRKSGAGRWVARCPAHEDRSPSLSIGEGTDGRLLMRCFAGCEVAEVVGAIGLDLSDLFPPRDGFNDSMRRSPDRRPFDGGDALRLIDFTVQDAATLILVASTGELTAEQRGDLAEAASIIHEARRACGLREVVS